MEIRITESRRQKAAKLAAIGAGLAGLLFAGPAAAAEPAGPLPEQGLLVYYSFDRDGGDTVPDDTGGTRTGRVQGATWVADGARGGTYRFDSNAQCILADDTGLPRGDEPRTMAVWIKLNVLYPEMTTGLFQYGAFGPGHYNHMSGVGMDWRNGRDQYYFSQYGGVALSEQKMTRPGEWHHLAYTYGGNGSHHLYVDGVPTDGMSELQGPIDTVLAGTLIIGGTPGAAGPNGGFLDEVRIYGRALSAAEIQELAAARKPLPPPAVAAATAAGSVPAVRETPGLSADVQQPAPPEITNLEPGPAEEETMVLTWVTVPGRTYEVQWTDELTRPFAVIASNLVAAGTEMTYTNLMRDARAAFYRVSIQK